MNEEFLLQRTLDHIVLEGQYDYYAYITIEGNNEDNKIENFNIKLEFINLDSATFKNMIRLHTLAKPLRIESNLIAKENFNITHIVLEKFLADTQFAMTWECHSKNYDLAPV